LLPAAPSVPAALFDPRHIEVRDIGEAEIDTAIVLLSRFFAEEGFSGAPETIAINTRRLWADPHHWVALAWIDGTAVGVTVRTMLYVEWGRLREIGDLYVLPEARRGGVGATLVHAAMDKCRALGCSAISVTITPAGEARHALTRFMRELWQGHRHPYPRLSDAAPSSCQPSGIETTMLDRAARKELEERTCSQKLRR
jgi:GNAT superfamily N-acetyltransferase